MSEAAVAPHIAQGLYFIGEDEAGVVGVFRFQREDRVFWPEMEEGTSAYLHKLAVLPARQGHEAAQGLLACACDLARARGLRFLRLDCIGGRPSLRGVYERFGFRHHSDRVLGRTTFHRFELELS
ncbi:MAG TPA: GNAT family N-acetyltransferase [Ramlibacter sp.]|nr:GNAT family N-acetyltransferase [Ramlibacter sp.]